MNERISHLRDIPEDARGAATVQLAQAVAALPPTANKLRLALSVAGMSTEGDYGQATTQSAADALSRALGEHCLPFVPLPSKAAQFSQQTLPARGYRSLALLVRYEHASTILVGDQHLKKAIAVLQAQDDARQQVDFSLEDLDGRQWTLSKLKGKVVLLNFWAIWCPPCRKEIPDLSALYNEFGSGLVILGVTDEKKEKVAPFVARLKIPYPVLLDPRHEFETAFGNGVDQGIPKSFVYNRDGYIVAQAIDARSARQFRVMLEAAGLR